MARSTARTTAAIAKLVSGPTTAMTNSVDGFFASPARFETPPKMKRVIERTSSPRDLATSEWASSWTTTEAKRRIAVIAPRSQYSTTARPSRPGTVGNTPTASDQVTSPKMTSQLTWTPTSIPAIRKRRTELPSMRRHRTRGFLDRQILAQLAGFGPSPGCLPARSPVRRLGGPETLPRDEDAHVGVPHDVPRHAAEKCPPERVQLPRTDDDEVVSEFASHPDDERPGVSRGFVRGRPQPSCAERLLGLVKGRGVLRTVAPRVVGRWAGPPRG